MYMDLSGVSSGQYFNQNAYSGDILSSQGKKKHKKIIIALLAVVMLAAAVVAVIFIPKGTTTSSANFDETAKAYSKYFIFGPNPDGSKSYYDLAYDDYYFYESGKSDEEYLKAVNDKLNKLASIAQSDQQKEELNEQSEWLTFYKVSTAYIDNYLSEVQYSTPENADSVLTNAYNSIGDYVGKKAAEASARESVSNDTMTTEEYAGYAVASDSADSNLRAWKKIAYNKMAQYAGRLYEEK